MQKGYLFSAIGLVLLAGALLLATRSLQIDRGLKLDPYVEGEFTYQVWSNGNWVESRQAGVHVSTLSAPYTLLLSIQPKQQNVQSIEMITASLIDKSGNKKSVIEKINQLIEKVELRPASNLNSPYAAFTFDSLLDSHSDITLEIEFRTGTSDDSDTIRQSLEVRGFEKKTRSFTFWDVMSSA